MSRAIGLLFLSILSSQGCAERRSHEPDVTRAEHAVDLVRNAGFSFAAPGHLAITHADTSTSPVHLASGDAWVDVASDAVVTVPAVSTKGARVFVDALPGTDIVHATTRAGFEELRVVGTKTDTIEARWRLRFGGAVDSVRVRAGMIELLDRTGKMRLATSPMFAVDAHGVVRSPSLRLSHDRDTATVVATLDAHDLAFPVVVDPAWSAIAAMTTGRRYHSLTQLSDGSVVAFGGRRYGTGDMGERYSASTNTWTKIAAPKNTYSSSFSSLRLADGRMLVAFGVADDGSLLSSAEIYDPKTDAWTDVSSGIARRDQVATLLPDGRVLFTGGYVKGSTSGLAATKLTSIYDPSKTTLAWQHASLLMTGGTVGMLVEARANHTAVLQKDGNVMLFGGHTDPDGISSGAELFSPSGFASSAIPAKGVAREGHSATLLPNGKILFAGGDGTSGGLATSQFWDGKAFSDGPVMTVPRTSFAEWALPSGVTIFAGGLSAAKYLSSAEAYDPTDNAFHALPDLAWAGDGMALAPLDATHIMLSGGGITGGGGFYSVHTEADVLPLASSAATCATNLDCATGHCVDGVCCDTACTGNCEACDVMGSAGTCTVVTGKPHGSRPACMPGGADICLTRTCNGVVRDVCSFYGAETTCASASCEGASAVAAATCDGNGACGTPVSTACGDYQCRSGKCLAACQSNDDCKSGAFCINGACRSGAKCSDDLTSSIGAGGSHSCAPNLCDQATGECIAQCKTSTDCAQGSACDVPSGQCMPNAPSTDSGGGCTVSRENTADFAFGIAALAAVGLKRRRRAR